MKTRKLFLISFIALALAAMFGCAPKIKKDDLRQDIVKIWNQGDLAMVDKYYAKEFVSHRPVRMI